MLSCDVRQKHIVYFYQVLHLKNVTFLFRVVKLFRSAIYCFDVLGLSNQTETTISHTCFVFQPSRPKLGFEPEFACLMAPCSCSIPVKNNITSTRVWLLFCFVFLTVRVYVSPCACVLVKKCSINFLLQLLRRLFRSILTVVCVLLHQLHMQRISLQIVMDWPLTASKICSNEN